MGASLALLYILIPPFKNIYHLSRFGGPFTLTYKIWLLKVGLRRYKKKTQRPHTLVSKWDTLAFGKGYPILTLKAYKSYMSLYFFLLFY